MKLKPCTEDLLELLIVTLLIPISVSLLLLLVAYPPPIALLLILVAILCPLTLIPDYLYLGRSITLDPKGCTFTLFRFRRSYLWEELEVQLDRGRGLRYYDGELPGLGLLIRPRGTRYSGKVAPMTYCRRFHPLSAVFLRFQDHPLPVSRRSLTFQGYTADRDALLSLLRSAGVQISV